MTFLSNSSAITGAANVTATGSTTARTLANRFHDVANVLDYGADPTGVADSSTAFNAACAATRNGHLLDVYAPTGTYLINNPINVGNNNYSQTLYGDGWGTRLHVSATFSTSATGVIVIAGTGIGKNDQIVVRDLHITFDQPADFNTTTTAQSLAGTNTITVASTSGIAVGQYVGDITNSTAIPYALNNVSALPFTTVSSIVGNVITLSSNLNATVASGDTIAFGMSRATFKTLAAGATIGAGGTGVQYPWAIYNNGSTNFNMDGILIEGAWNGIYQRGGTFHFGTVFMHAFNIGLDIDNCLNFPQIETYEFWGFGLFTAVGRGTFYDGATIAANIGNCGVSIANLQIWTGIVNLTSTFQGGMFANVSMDGSWTNFNANGASSSLPCHIGNFYSTKGLDSTGVALLVNGGNVIISNFYMACSGNGAISSGIQVTASGRLSILSGKISNFIVGSYPMISQSGGVFFLSDIEFVSGTRTDTFFSQTGGSFIGNHLLFGPACIPGAGAIAFSLTDNAFNQVNDVVLNGWQFTSPGTLGSYPIGVSGINNKQIGNTTPSTGAFTTLTASGAATFGNTGSSLGGLTVPGTAGSTSMQYSFTNAGAVTGFRLFNNSTTASTKSQLTLATGSSNSYCQYIVTDASVANIITGSALAGGLTITSGAGPITLTPATGTILNNGLITPPRIVTAAGAITMTATDNIVIVNKTVGATTAVTLMTSPATGQRCTVKDGKGDGNVNNLTISPASGTIDGAASFVINVAYGSVDLIATSSTTWAVI